MAAPNETFHVDADLDQHNDASHDVLTNATKWALVGESTAALASFIATLSLSTLLFHRLFVRRPRHTAFLPHNQYVVLLLNLICADFFQASGFVISFYWIAKDSILSPHVACAVQGSLITFGDLASAFFILLIAAHTYVTAALGLRIEYSTFYVAICMAWVVAFSLFSMGVAIGKDKFLERIDRWCTFNSRYLAEHVSMHACWLFLSMAGITVLYALTFFKLRRKTSHLFAGQSEVGHGLANGITVQSVNRITKLMMLYPIVYITLVLPAFAIQGWNITHGDQSVEGDGGGTLGRVSAMLIASCGWVDCLLYTLTRKRLIKETMEGGESGSHGSRGPLLRRSSRNRSEPIEIDSGILRTTTMTVHRDSFDASGGQRMPPPLVYTEIWAGESKQPRAKEERLREHPVYERSPSPIMFVEAGFARSDRITALTDLSVHRA